MNIVADLHTHTSVSHHAYSTIVEMCKGAKKAGHIALGTTDHGPALQDGAHQWHFQSLEMFIPRILEGVYVLRGAEANILQPDGRLDIPDHVLDTLDYVVASIHNETFLERDPDRITEIMLKVLENPRIDILGHLGAPIFKFDYETLISKCNEYDKVVEVNNNSFYARKGSKENCLEIAKLCKKYDVPISVNSDAHFCLGVGKIDRAQGIIEAADFPEELIINASPENLQKYFMRKKGLDILGEIEKVKESGEFNTLD